jgi:hypothetical protein
VLARVASGGASRMLEDELGVTEYPKVVYLILFFIPFRTKKLGL